MNAPVIQIRTRPALGEKHLFALRIENHAGNQWPGVLRRQRDVVHGKTMREVRGAVQRIDIPAIIRRPAMSAAFFSHDRVRWKMRPQPLYDELLGRAIRGRHQIVLTLQLKCEMTLEE